MKIKLIKEVNYLFEEEWLLKFTIDRPKQRTCRQCGKPTQVDSYFHCAYHKKLADSMAENNEDCA